MAKSQMESHIFINAQDICRKTDKMPQLNEIPLYRYMVFERFLEILDKGLFIPKASLFNDRWEAMLSHMHEYLKERNTSQLLSKYGQEEKIPSLEDFYIQDIHKSIHEGKKEVYVSCWNGTHYECIAMWSLYGKEKNGILLGTNAKELTDTFTAFDESENKEWLAVFKKMEYVLPGNHNDKVFKGKEPIWSNDSNFKNKCLQVHFRFQQTFTGLSYKHISFTFENEYRLLAAHTTRGERPGKGIILPLKPSFIKKVILQPNSSVAFHNLVKDCLKKYGFNDVIVEKSFLDELPPLDI